MAIRFIKEAAFQPDPTLLQPGPDVIPTDREINRFAEMYMDCFLHGTNADIYHQPWRFAQVTKDAKKKIQRFILGVIVGWKDFTSIVSKVLIKDGYEKSDIQECLEYVQNSGQLNAITQKLNQEIKKHIKNTTVLEPLKI